MGESPTAAWAYVNDLRFGGIFLGSAMVILGTGMLVVMVGGVDAADTADFLLAIGIFLLIFTVVLSLPRIRSRGGVSYSLHVERSMDDVEDATRSALAGMGHQVHVDVKASRSRRPPRVVHADGLNFRFLVRAAPYREERGKGTTWTELVQVGMSTGSDEVARELRDQITARLAAPSSSNE